MKFVIKHEIRGRIRFHVAQKNMSYREADILQYYLDSMQYVSSASPFLQRKYPDRPSDLS